MRRIAASEGEAALAAALNAATASAGVPPADRIQLATAVRYTLQLLADKAPGHAVEVRVPPFGAVQILEGTTHRRGTPPAVIETDPHTWLALATGTATWADAVAAGRVLASGERADLAALLPVIVDPGAGPGAQLRTTI